ncbi:MAG: helix-turn-helix domain-containing protein [Gammaproteobacteria bacterium]
MVQSSCLERYMPNLPVYSSTGIFPHWISTTARVYRMPAGRASLPAIPDPCVTVVLSGDGVRLTRGLAEYQDTALLFSGAVSVVPANRAVTWQWDGPIELIQLHISSAYLRETEQSMKFVVPRRGVLDNVVFNDPLIAQIGRRIAGVLTNGGNDASPGYLQSFTMLLVSHLAEVYFQEPQAPHYADAGSLDSNLGKAIVYIHEHLDRDLPLEDMACAAHLSRFHFHRCFKRKIGLSPREYVLEHRLDLAKHLLTRTATPINGIVRRCGFRAHSYFTTVFRKATGKTPRDYRRVYSTLASWALLASCSALALLMSASTSGGMYLESCLAST